MGGGRAKKKRKAFPTTPNKDVRSKEQETIRLINDALSKSEGLRELRQLAAVKGLVNSQLRSQCWHKLLGVSSETDDVPMSMYEEWCAAQHRDRHVVEVDVERSLWSFTQGFSDAERAVKREELARLLNAVVGYHQSLGEDAVYYYQGLHDVASVLLMVCGERAAFPLLCRLCTCHLRDCTRNRLDAVLELLELIWPLLEEVDPELGRTLRGAGLPPFFALSWFITWFAHDVSTLQDAARLFDLFLSSHPLMPLYVGVAAMCSHRQSLLACEDMPHMHGALVNLELCKHASVDELATRALLLLGKKPPAQLLQRIRGGMRLCVAPRAQLKRDHWEVPRPAELSAPHAAGRGGSGSKSPLMGGKRLLRLLAQLGPRTPASPPPGRQPARGSNDDSEEEEAGSKGRGRGVGWVSVGGLVTVYVFAAVATFGVMKAQMWMGNEGGVGIQAGM